MRDAQVRHNAFLIASLALVVSAALPVVASSTLAKLDLSSVFDAAGETVIAEAPEEVKEFYCVVFSPDMRSVGYAARVYQGVHPKESVYLNDEAGPMFDFVRCDQKIKDEGLHAFKTGVNSLTFSGDGSSFAYQARLAKQKWRFVLDGEEHWKIKGNFHFSPSGGNLAAKNCESIEGCCWRTGKDVGKKKQKDETCPSLVMFPEKLGGKAVPVYYDFGEDGRKRVVVGGKKGPWFKEVRGFRMSEDGKHHSYIGCRSKGDCTAVFDGTDAGVSYARILAAIKNLATGKAAIIAKTDKGVLMNHGGVEGSRYRYITTPPVFDGKGNVFYLAEQGEERFAIVRQGDGKKALTGSCPCIHLMSEERPGKLSASFPFTPEVPVKLSPDGERYAFLACCNSCCKPLDSGQCKKAGCLSTGADFQMKVVINKNKPAAINKGTGSKCYPPGSIHGFTWSADGSKFAYGLHTGKSSSIFVNNKAVVSRSGEKFSDPLFTPDAGQVVFVSWKQKKGKRTGRVYAGTTPVSEEYDYIELPLHMSGDGKKVAFNAIKGRTFLLVVNELTK